MTTSLKRSMTVTGVAVAALVLAACGAGENGGGGSASPTQSGSAAADPKAAAQAILTPLMGEVQWPAPTKLSKPIDLKGKTVWWIPIGDAVPVIHGIGVGFTQAVEAAGGTVKLCDGKFNPVEIGNCLKSAADQNADAVTTAYVDYAMLPTGYDALTAKGIPVLVAGEAPSGGKSNSNLLAFNDPSVFVAKLYSGTAAAAIAAQGSNANGLFTRLMDSSLTTNASDAAIASFTQLCATCKITSIDFTTPTVDKLSSAVSAALVQNPDINVVMVPVDSFVPPVAQAIKTAGKQGQIKVYSTSGDLANMQDVKAGGVQAGDLGTPVIYVGWDYARGLFQLLVGDKVEPSTELTNRYFDSSNIGGLTLNPDTYLSNDWYGNGSYEAAFKAAWGLS